MGNLVPSLIKRSPYRVLQFRWMALVGLTVWMMDGVYLHNAICSLMLSSKPLVACPSVVQDFPFVSISTYMHLWLQCENIQGT